MDWATSLVKWPASHSIDMKLLRKFVFLMISVVILSVIILKIKQTEVINNASELQIDFSDLTRRVENNSGLYVVSNIRDLFKSEKNKISRIRFYRGTIHRNGNSKGDKVVYIKLYHGNSGDNILYTYDLSVERINELRRLYRSEDEAFGKNP